MSRLERLIGDRVAVPIVEVEKWIGRGHSYVYRAIGRGDLRKFDAGQITAASLIEWCARIEAGRSESVPMARRITDGSAS